MKKILSIILSASMLLSCASVFAEGEIDANKASKEYTNPIADQLLAESATLDTSVFEGAPGYILQDTFSNVNGVDSLGVPSGWDFDKRGGKITGSENSKFQMIDTDENNVVSISKELMTHKSGKITMETAFNMSSKTESGFFYEITGEGKTVVKIITDKNNICVVLPDGTIKAIGQYKKETVTPVKAVIDMETKTVEVISNGVYGGKFPFKDDASQVDRITVSTAKEKTMTVWVRYVYMYINYAVYENFMTAPEGTVPYGWELFSGGIGSGVVYDANQVYPDTYSLALNDVTSIEAVNIEKKFEDKKGKVAFETRFILESKCDGVEFYIGNGTQKAVSLKTAGADIVTGTGEVAIKNYLDNLWYTVKIEADVASNTADVYINYQKVLTGIPFEAKVNSLNTLRYGTPLRKEVNLRIDDVAVYNVVVLSDYVTKPQVVVPDDGLEVGMQMYSMWNEGNHWGWDWISAYPDRIPYLGLYAEGKPEVADWVTKWQTEHGFTFRTEIFSRASANLNQPIKLPTRYHALYNGYLNSEYKESIKFAVLWAGISTNTLGGMEDFKQNFVPHFIENFFKQPNYLTKDNKPVMFMYGAGTFVSIMGGMDKANEALEYLSEECKKIGYDGFILIPDGSSGGFIANAKDFGDGYAYVYGMEYASRRSETQLELNDSYIESGAKVVGSVPMGWGRNPWTEKNAGEIFSTPEDTKNTILGLKERYKNLEDPSNMIMLTCWDEYGEGHFFAPTRVEGFGYLNAVRDAVTKLGPKTTEELPTARAMARMDSLYIGSRRALKLVPENDPPIFIKDTLDESKLQVLAEWDFEKMGNIGEWKVSGDVTNLRYEDGALRGNSTARDPQIWVEGLMIPAEDVKMVKIVTSTAGAGEGQFFYQTTVDTSMGINGKRFDFIQDTEEFKEYTSFPNDAKKLQGYITAVRWDPKNDGFPTYTDFAVKKIQILGYHEEGKVTKPDPVGLTFNDEPIKITRAPFTKDGITYFAPHRPFMDMKFKTTFDFDGGIYTIEVDDKVGILTMGSNIMKLNGVDVDLGGAVYYEDGNVFAPMRPLLEALGVTVKWNGEKNTIDLYKLDPTDDYQYQSEVDKSKPFSWMFETRGLEGWTANTQVGLFMASKGSLVVECVGNDPNIASPNVSIPADEYRYMKIRMKNTTDAGDAFMLFILSKDTTWGGDKRITFNVSKNDTEFKEYIVDLASVPKWSGDTVTRLRFDPVNPGAGVEAVGKIYIDSIEFLKELPQ